LERLAAQSHYWQRRQQVDQQNAASKTELRGLALTAMKFGIAFTSKFMNQANALVNVYTDGTVQISSGATEMGQGVYVKLQQMVADAFAITADRVVVMPTSTEKNNNTSPTAASASADLNGAAALGACKEIVERLRAFAAQRLTEADPSLKPLPQHIVFADSHVYDCRHPEEKIAFAQLCHEARRERVDLGARGFFATPGIDFDRETAQGKPFFYYTQGAAVAEVRIDRFTGELRVSRVDLLIDIGRSINPGVDRGQIIGGFIQGMGWVTTEALVYDEQGALLSFSPTTYKIPAVTDLPEIFYVDTFGNEDNMKNVCRSKAVGEPPLMLGISVWAAVKNALGYLAPGQPVDLRLPATGEEVLRCLTEGAQRCKEAKLSTSRGQNIEYRARNDE
jgi:xanthine dehydrogenase large subunit